MDNTSEITSTSSQNTSNMSLVSLLQRGTELTSSQIDYYLIKFRDFIASPPEKQTEIIVNNFKDLISKMNRTFIYLLLGIFTLILGVKLTNQGTGGSKKQKSKKSRKLRKSRK